MRYSRCRSRASATTWRVNSASRGSGSGNFSFQSRQLAHSQSQNPRSRAPCGPHSRLRSHRAAPAAAGRAPCFDWASWPGWPGTHASAQGRGERIARSQHAGEVLRLELNALGLEHDGVGAAFDIDRTTASGVRAFVGHDRVGRGLALGFLAGFVERQLAPQHAAPERLATRRRRVAALECSSSPIAPFPRPRSSDCETDRAGGVRGLRRGSASVAARPDRPRICRAIPSGARSAIAGPRARP